MLASPWYSPVRGISGTDDLVSLSNHGYPGHASFDKLRTRTETWLT